jgi:hypothetical protein
MFAVPSFFGYNTTFVSTPVATAATGVGQTSFTANWNAFVGAQYYLLDVSISSSFSSFILQDKVVYTNSYAVTGLTASTTYYYRLRASTTYEADAAAFFTRVTSAGGSLTTTEQQAVNSLVIQMKADGIWTPMKAVYPMVGASAAACAQNLKSSSFTGTFTSGWTFASTGVTPNGTSAYMNTGIKVSVDLALNSNSFSFYSRTEKDALEPDMGGSVQNATTTELNVYTRFGNQIYFRNNSNNIAAAATNISSLGLFVNNRNSSSETRNRIRTTLVTQSNTSNTANSSNIYISAVGNNSGTLTFSTRQIAFAHIGDGLTDTNSLDLVNAVQSFQTTLSRNV